MVATHGGADALRVEPDPTGHALTSARLSNPFDFRPKIAVAKFMIFAREYGLSNFNRLAGTE